MGLLRRARSIHGASRSDRLSVSGLLRKSLEIIEKSAPLPLESAPVVEQEEPDALPAESIAGIPVIAAKTAPETVPRTWKEAGLPTREQRVERLWTELSELERGIEAPGRLYSLIKAHLQLPRGALLLYEPMRMAFVPWAMHGFDSTTAHRLRIPLKANDTMNRLASGKVHLLSSPEELNPFSQFFSFREFSTLENLLLVPFVHESKFMGLLLCANHDPVDIDTFEILADKAASRLYEARERYLEGAKREIPERPESLKETVRAAVAPCLDLGLSPLLIRITTTTLTDSVLKRNPYIDLYRLRQDVSRVLLSIFQSIGSVFRIDRERMLIVVCNPAQPIQDGDQEILLHHLKATLLKLLPELSGEQRIPLDAQVRLPKPDTEEVLTQLAEIV